MQASDNFADEVLVYVLFVSHLGKVVEEVPEFLDNLRQTSLNQLLLQIW